MALRMARKHPSLRALAAVRGITSLKHHGHSLSRLTELSPRAWAVGRALALRRALAVAVVHEAAAVRRPGALRSFIELGAVGETRIVLTSTASLFTYRTHFTPTSDKSCGILPQKHVFKSF